MRSDERITLLKYDVNKLLVDQKFLKENKGRIGCAVADVPYGFFKDDVSDVRWSKGTVTTVATALYSLCHSTGTVVIKMADRDHDLWREALEQAGFHVERDRKHLLDRVAHLRKKAYLSHAPCINGLHYWLIAHKEKRNYYVHAKQFGKEGGGVHSHPLPSFTITHPYSHTFTIITQHSLSLHEGTLSTGSYPANSNVFVDVPPVPQKCRLKDEHGRVVRVQETCLQELLELWHRYCNPKLLGFDLCTGTGVSVLAMLRLGLRGIVNDRDGEVIDLAEARARNYMDHLFRENGNQFPPLNQRHMTQHDGTDLYAWVQEALTPGVVEQKCPSTCLVLPTNNYPRFLSKNMTDVEFKQVRMSGWLCMLVVYVQWVVVLGLVSGRVLV